MIFFGYMKKKVAFYLVLVSSSVIIIHSGLSLDTSAQSLQNDASCRAASQALKKLQIQEILQKLKILSNSSFNVDFEALVACKIPVVVELTRFLDSRNSNVRAISAYALFQIHSELSLEMNQLNTMDFRVPAHENLYKNIVLIQDAFTKQSSKESDPDVLTILESIHVSELPSTYINESGETIVRGPTSSPTPVSGLQKQIVSNAKKSPPIICNLPGIKRILPRC
jgi:hypothetical protein